MKKIALLGSTGSIGRQVLSVVDSYPDKFKITALAANSSFSAFEEQMFRYKPDIATLTDIEAAKKITAIPDVTSFYYGENSILHAATSDADIVFVAVMGFCGLKAVLAAIEAGKDVAIANKETLVAGGELVTSAAKRKGVRIIPVDSEHSAIWQALDFGRIKKFRRLILTASGGAFRDLPLEALDTVTAKEALNHPNWRMGDKITVDCATMTNKAFEVAEAGWLFDAPFDKISVVMHRESIVHSMVEFPDGAVIAQLSSHDMRLPIALALTYPERLESVVPPLGFDGLKLNFGGAPDVKRYPCYKLILDAIKSGKNYPCAASAANEVAVRLFLSGKIKFTGIYNLVAHALDGVKEESLTYESLDVTDKLARKAVYEGFQC